MYTLEPLCNNQPPPLPTHYVERTKLLKEITEKVLTTEIDNTIHITVVITGMAGFGKSTLAKALCHQQLIKKHFRSGFLVIELGPKSMSKSLKLCEIYLMLTGYRWTNPTACVQGTINEDEMIACLSKELKAFCKRNPKLLVIIDDVWQVEDAEDYAEIFSGCKIVLTTRRKDVASSIHCKHIIHIDSMESFEAIQLLTFKIDELQGIIPKIVDQLNELAINLHNWPLLLNLVRTQLYKCCIGMPNSPLAVIKQVTKRLFDNGLTAFDPKDPKKVTRRNAANASIKASFDLLRIDSLNKLKKLIVSMYFSNKVPKGMLSYAWQLNDEQVFEVCDELWSVGLISHTMLPFDIAGIEIHLVITQYVFDNITSKDFVEVSLYSMTVEVRLIQYHMDLLHNLAERLDDTQLYLYTIDILDSVNIPAMLHKIPMTMQAFALIMYNLNKNFLSKLGIQKIEKQTFLGVREKFKKLWSYLNGGKKDQAVAYIIEANEKHIHYATSFIRIMCSSPEIHPSIREKLNLLVDPISRCFPQLAKAYVDMRSDLHTLWIVKKSISVHKAFEIYEAFDDQLVNVAFPILHGIEEVLKMLYSLSKYRGFHDCFSTASS